MTIQGCSRFTCMLTQNQRIYCATIHCQVCFKRNARRICQVQLQLSYMSIFANNNITSIQSSLYRFYSTIDINCTLKIFIIFIIDRGLTKRKAAARYNNITIQIQRTAYHINPFVERTCT